MGCGCGKTKTPADRAATQRAAAEHQATRGARNDPRSFWNGPKKKPAKPA